MFPKYLVAAFCLLALVAIVNAEEETDDVPQFLEPRNPVSVFFLTNNEMIFAKTAICVVNCLQLII